MPDALMGAVSYRNGDNVYVPVLQIRHKSVVRYDQPLFWASHRNNKKVWLSKNLHKTAYSGRMTQGLRKRMTKAVNILLQTIEPKWIFNEVTGQYQYHKLSFITLKITNAGTITARDAYDNCLNHFLDWMTRTQEAKLYVWKAEGEIRGQIHYHITTPTFIHYLDIRKKWNSLLRQSGYLDRYAKEHGHFDANSTNVHEVNDVQNLAPYILKAFADSLEAAEKIKKVKPGRSGESIGAEMGKEVQNEKGTIGKIWGCSELLSAAHYVSFYMEGHHEKVIEQLKIDKKIREVSDDSGRWCVWYFNDTSPPDILTAAENSYVIQYLKWQMQKPSKGSPEDDLLSWSAKKPSLN